MKTLPLPDAVQWSEGMLLSPQHLQQNDIYWHEQLRHRLSCITPHYWGLLHMKVELIKENVVINELECVLPDGTSLTHPGNFPRQPEPVLQLNVSACKSGEAPMRVWLLVPERGPCAARQSDQDRRFNSQIGQLTVDENTGESGITVPRLQTRYELVLSRLSPSTGQCACPLLEVERDAAGILRIGTYLPPMLRLSASSHLGTHCLHSLISNKHESWWGKVEELFNEASGKHKDGKLTIGGVRNQLVARHLASALPGLSMTIEASCHPQALYQALAPLIACMTMFAESPLPPKLLPYQHDDCLPQFQAAWRYIEETLAVEMQRIEQERLSAPKPVYEVHPFQAHGDYGFGRKLPVSWEDDLIIEVKPHHGQSLEDIGRWLNQADIASGMLISQLRRQRIPGAQVRQLTPDEIQRRQLPPLADLFTIQNRKVELGVGIEQDLFAPDQSLFIQGKSDKNMPAAIYLHHKLPRDNANASN
ncbi:type VI secretion system baseplate subunit TssK [Undibacterium crateris]|uniref:type VI secretion system baseplate subunit TssK n=1 Tax=Undibacterium crateris TaxID=2528175 RepID=UPI00138A1E56|nr:type VI secretion system baseplate subunit TssK [Undibacterium crateris]NDI84154.1 type VI secretion system baseplate subunit TssK [Undibacterium crateris]